MAKEKEAPAQAVEEEAISPGQYFDFVKESKQLITTQALKESYEAFVKLGEKYNRLGQKESLKKLCFLADTLVKEEKLIEMGVTTFIYKDVVEDYIEHVADKAVKVVELARYTREIPDELVEVIEKTRAIFDEFYVVFTDYTGKEERRVQKERREKDPILFGVFKKSGLVADRFYFLGDWVDEYCDLTLDKLIEQYETAKGESPAITIEVPKTPEELASLLHSYQEVENKTGDKTAVVMSDNSKPLSVGSYKKSPGKPKATLFDKVRSIFKDGGN